MLITRVNASAGFAVGSGSNVTKTITATGTGNLIVVFIVSATPTALDTPGLATITDNAGNIYQTVPGAFGSINQGGSSIAYSEIWYAKNSIAGATSVTITPFSNFNGGVGLIAEYSGVDTNSPVVQGQALTSASGAPSLSPVLTTSHSTDLLVADIYKFGSFPTGVTAPWVAFPATFGDAIMVEAIAPGNAGTYQAVYTPAQTDGYSASGAVFAAVPYSFHRSITIDHTKVGTVGNTDQTNFPVLVSVTNSTLRTVANGGHVQNTNGYDIVFAADVNNATPLSWEIESYDPVAGTIIAWVKVPTVSHSTNTTIYMLYGNAAVSTFQSISTAVWDSNYNGVYHLGNSSGLSLNDSTSNALNLTNNGGITSAAGQIGLGADLSVQPQYFSAGIASDFNLTTAGTLSAWLNTSTTNPQSLMEKEDFNTDRNGFAFGIFGSTNILLELASGSASQDVSGSTTLSPGTSYYAVATWDSSNVRIYLQGLQDGTAAQTVVPVSNVHSLVMGFSTSVNAFQTHAIVDEYRLSSVARSADWIITEYNNQNSPSTFSTLGPENGGGFNKAHSSAFLVF